MNRCLPYFVSISQWRAIAPIGKRKEELTLPSSLLTSDALVSPIATERTVPSPAQVLWQALRTLPDCSSASTLAAKKEAFTPQDRPTEEA